MKNKKIPMRRCVGCMESKSKRQLIRMVNQDGEVKIDRTGKANGRGIYLCENRDCFEKAKKKKAINRGLKLDLDDEKIDLLQKEFFENN